MYPPNCKSEEAKSTPKVESLEQYELIEEIQDVTILCNHCKRTKNNNISCLGMCVADNEY